MPAHHESIHFIISAPRSGSTWLAEALNGHPDIFATENRLFGSFCEMWPNNRGEQSPRITFDSYADAFSRHSFHRAAGLSRADFTEAYLREYFEFLTSFLKRQSGKSLLIDKITPYLGTSEQVLDGIERFFPDAKIIQLQRDGRDVATSGVFDWIAREPPDSARHRFFVSREPGLQLPRLFDDGTLQDWARYWTGPISALSDRGKEVLVVRFEEMLLDQAAQLTRIFEYLGVSSSREIADQCAEACTFNLTRNPAHEASPHPLSKRRKGTAGDWKNYFTHSDGELFQATAGHWLQSLDYARDSDWYRELPETLSLEMR